MPMPSPATSLPSARKSTVASCLASTNGWRVGATRTPMPTRRRVVRAAYAAAIATPSSSGLPAAGEATRSATQTESQPSSSSLGPRRRSSAGGGIPWGLRALATNPNRGGATRLLPAGRRRRGPPVVVERLPVQAVARSERLGAVHRVGVPGADLQLVAVGVLEVDRDRVDRRVRAGSRERDAHGAEVLAHAV